MAYRTERIFVLTTILLVGLGLALAISRGALGGSGENGALLWTMTIALVIVAGAGSMWLRSGFEVVTVGGQAMVTSSAVTPTLAPPESRRFALPLEVIVPALLVGGYTLFIQLFESGIVQTVILVLATLSLAAVYWAQVHASLPSDRYFGLAQAILNVVSHLCAFLLFATIYGLKSRSLISASAVSLVTFLIVYELLMRDTAWHKAMNQPVEGRRSTIALMSIVCGLVLGELIWGLNYWAAVTTLVGGAFLLVAFYVVYGLVSHYIDHNLNRQTILEFGLVGMVGMIAVFTSAFIVG